MSKTPEQIAALKSDLQEWMDGNGLANGARWQTPEEFYGDKRSAYEVPPLLFLHGQDVHEITCHWDLLATDDQEPRPGAFRMKREFMDILKHHGFEHDFDRDPGGAPVVCFFCSQDSQEFCDKEEAAMDADHAQSLKTRRAPGVNGKAHPR